MIENVFKSMYNTSKILVVAAGITRNWADYANKGATTSGGALVYTHVWSTCCRTATTSGPERDNGGNYEGMLTTSVSINKLCKNSLMKFELKEIFDADD